MLPVSGAVTYNAPPGPTALPWSSSKPVTNRVAVGAAAGLFAAAAMVLPTMSILLSTRTNTSLFQFMRLLLSILNDQPELDLKPGALVPMIQEGLELKISRFLLALFLWSITAKWFLI
jgi:hypothetical protein